MKTESRIAATLAILAFGGMGFYLRQPKPQPAAPSVAPSVAPRQEALPVVALAESQARRVTRIELTRPDDDDALRVQTITLEKLGQDWEMTSPLRTRASASKVKALLDNLQVLTLVKVLEPSAGSDEAYDLTDAKALHVVAWTGEDKVSDLSFGRTVPEGQVARTPAIPGALVVANSGSKGYSGFLYTRGVRSWRETSIFQFRADEATRVEITNANGVFSFSRDGTTGWVGSFTPRGKSGVLESPEGAWKRFDPSKVDDLLRVYQSLGADDFGTDADRARSGVDDAESTGGVLRITLAGDRGDRALRVGKLTKSTTRWALAGSRWAIAVGGDGTLYALSPWTAGWATADASRFEGTTADPPP